MPTAATARQLTLALARSTLIGRLAGRVQTPTATTPVAAWRTFVASFCGIPRLEALSSACNFAEEMSLLPRRGLAS